MRHSEDRSRLLGAAAALAAAVALALWPASPAQAHDSLVSSSPANGATVSAAPRSVALTFDEPVLDYADSTVLIVTGPGAARRHFETACARVDGRTVSAPVALGASGRYTVTWRVVSADGHPVAATFAFTLHRSAGTAAAAGSATGPACGSGSTAGATAPTSSGSSVAVSPAVWVVLGIAGGLVLVLLVVVVGIAVHVRRRPGKEAGDAGRKPA